MLSTKGHIHSLYDTVALNISDRCNLRCLHCYNASGEGICRDMNLEGLKHAADLLLKLKPLNICICGGEPLCSPHLMPLLDYLKSRVPQISMVTNGYLMDEQTAQKLVACGVRSVQVSLDGAYAWQHDTLRGREGAFDRAINAIRLLRQAHMPQVMVSILPTINQSWIMVK